MLINKNSILNYILFIHSYFIFYFRVSEEEIDDSQNVNIMCDRRVIRGNTYALQRSLAVRTLL